MSVREEVSFFLGKKNYLYVTLEMKFGSGGKSFALINDVLSLKLPLI